MIAIISVVAIHLLAIGKQETLFFSPTSFEGDRGDDLRAMWCGSSYETRQLLQKHWTAPLSIDGVHRMSAVQALRSSGVLEVHFDQSDSRLVGCHFNLSEPADHHQ